MSDGTLHRAVALFDLESDDADAQLVTVDAQALAAALARAARCIGPHGGAGLGWLWLATVDGHLVVTASNRYAIAQADVEAAGDLPLIGVAPNGCRELVAALRPVTGRVVLEYPGHPVGGLRGTLTAANAAMDDEQVTVLAVPAEPRERAAVAHICRLLTDYGTRHGQASLPGAYILLNPALLALFDAGKTTPARLWFHGEHKPAYVEVDEHWRGLLMPMGSKGRAGRVPLCAGYQLPDSDPAAANA